MFGFHFSETMQGTYTRDGAPERDISFTVTARATSWLQHLRDHKATLDGTIRMEGFASSVPLTGELLINPVFGHIIKYDFQFTADDGKAYHFRGQNEPRFERARRIPFATNSLSVGRREFVAKRMLSIWRYYPDRESGTVSDRERQQKNTVNMAVLS